MACSLGKIAFSNTALVAKFLCFELFFTVFLDTANELIGIIGGPLVLGQAVRACFVVLNLFVVLLSGKRRVSEALILIYLFFAFMVVRELTHGLNALYYAALYWSKVLLYISAFFAIKCAVDAKALNVKTIEKFFKWSIHFIAPAFLVLVMVGLLEQRSFDLGFQGAILSKNSMSATLLLLFAVSMFMMFRGRIAVPWVCAIAVALFLLGSKSTMFFVAAYLIATAIYELRCLTPKGLLTLLLLVTGIFTVFFVFKDSISLAIETQFQRFQYVVNQQGGTLFDYLLTGRNTLLEAGFASYLDSCNPLSILIGNGVTSLFSDIADAVNAPGMYRGIEMDVFEIALTAGLLGLLITFSPIVIALRALSKHRVRHSFFLVLGTAVILCFMALGGHVITEGMPASFLGFYLAYIYSLAKPESGECDLVE